MRLCLVRPHVVISAALSCLVSASAAAQVTTAALAGRVTGTDGSPVVGATVAAVYRPTGAKYGAVTDDQGRYRLGNLHSGGPYEVSVRRIGYHPATRDSVYLALGATEQVSLAIETSAVNLSTVAVTADASGLMARSHTGPATNVGRKLLESLPTLSRSLQDFTRLTPQGGANSFAGTNFRYNNITIDGAANNDVVGFSNSYGGISGTGPSGTPGAGTRTQPISLDAVDEVQVTLAPYDVRLGNFTGASVNAVTRSGTNTTSGSFYGFGRNQATTGPSADAARSAIPAYKDYTIGGRLGGPLMHDKAFYFFTAEGAHRDEPVAFAPGDPGTVFTAPQALALRDTLKARYGYDAGSIGAYRIRTANTKLFGRLDFNLSDTHKLDIRNNFIDANAGQLTRGPLAIYYGGQDFIQRNTTNSTVVELRSTFTNGTSNDLILSGTFTHEKRDPTGTIFPQLEISGPSGSTIFLGTNREAAVFDINTKVGEITDNLVISRDRHTFTFGTHNELYGIQYDFQNAYNGRWQYSSLDNFYANKPSRIRGTYSLSDNSYAAVKNLPVADFKVLWPAVYAQDEIAVTERLHVTPGIRVDYPIFPDKPAPSQQFLSTQYNGTTPFAKYNESHIGGNVYFSPRVSFNWDARGDGTLQLRGGTGVFTGRVPFAWYAYAYYNNGVRFNNVDCRPGPTAGCAGNSAVVPLVTDPSQLRTLQNGVYEMNVIDNHFKLPTVERTSLGADWKVGHGTTLTLEGMFTKSLNDIKFLNVGLRDSTTASPVDGRPVFQGSPVALRVNPNITSVFLLTNTHRGERYSLTGQIQQDVGAFHGSVAYTHGESKDVSNGIRNSPQSNWEYNQVADPRNPSLTYSNFDVRHRIVGTLAWNREWARGYRFGASMVYTGTSGSPFTYTYINDYNRDGSSNNDVIYVPKDEADARIVPTAADVAAGRTAHSIWTDLDSFINSQPGLRDSRGKIVARNAGRTPWNHEVDLRFSQDVPVASASGHRVQITLDVINALAAFGSTLGRQYFVPNENNSNFPTMRVTSTAPNGTPTGFSFDKVVGNTPWQYDALNSRYQAQLGLRYSF